MATRQISVLPTSDEAAAAARELMATYGTVEQVGGFLVGRARDTDVAAMQESGCVVEIIPDQSQIGWLEPGSSPAAIAPLADEARNPALAELGKAAVKRYVVQFAGPLRPAWHEEVEKLGIKLGAYVPRYAYKVGLTPEQRAALERMLGVRRVVDYGPEQTARRAAIVEGGRERGEIDGDPARRSVIATSQSPEGAPIYDLKCHDSNDLPRVEEVLKSDPRVTRVDRGRNRLRVVLKDEASTQLFVAEIAELRQVSVIERYQIPSVELAFVRRALAAPDPAPGRFGPTAGEGELIGVADTGVDRDHPDLASRVQDVKAWAATDDPRDPKGHGTHVCGIICGDGTASGGELTGVAPRAKLFMQALADQDGRLVGIPVDLNTLFKEAYDAGVRIHNNSWGAVVNGLYTIDAFEIDQFVHEHPDFLIVIAAGNTGQQDPANLSGRIEINSLQSPAASKNALTVGACCSLRADGPYAGKSWRFWKGQLPAPTRPPVAEEPISGDADVVAAFSSRGPTDESRVKPDLLAPGTEVVSTASASSLPHFPFAKFASNYCVMSGTSMAAPAVSAAAALVRRWFIETHDLKPSAALLKATLINGARWINRSSVLDDTIGQPNFHQGFGRLDLSQTLPSNGVVALAFADIGSSDPLALSGDNPERSVWRRRLTVKSPGRLCITLVWSDPPGHGLQHNLNLVVVGPVPDRTIRTGNDGLKRAPFEKLDRTNNVEQVLFHVAPPGTYLVQVVAQNTLFGPQGFSIVATGAIDPIFD